MYECVTRNFEAPRRSRNSTIGFDASRALNREWHIAVIFSDGNLIIALPNMGRRGIYFGAFRIPFWKDFKMNGVFHE